MEDDVYSTATYGGITEGGPTIEGVHRACAPVELPHQQELRRLREFLREPRTPTDEEWCENLRRQVLFDLWRARYPLRINVY